MSRFARHVILWTLVGLFFFSQDVAQASFARETVHWVPLLECWLLRAYVWGLLAPVVLRLARRMRNPAGYGIRWVAVHFAYGCAAATVAALLTGYIGYLLAIPWYRPDLWTATTTAFAFGFHASLFTYWTLVAACEVFDNYRSSCQAALESAGLRAELAQTQLQVLRNQLQPHFIFNALNSIVALVRRHRNAQAEELTGRLGELLRRALAAPDVQEIPLREELQFLQSYLDIERVRFQDRLRTDLHLCPETLDALVPYMCLQPLAENAIRHGVAARPGPGTVTVATRMHGTLVEITIADDGPGFASHEPRCGNGIGIANTRARLRQLYGKAGALNIDSSREHGSVVTVTVPYHAVEVHRTEHATQRLARTRRR